MMEGKGEEVSGDGGPQPSVAATNCVRLKGFGFSHLKSIIRVQEKIYNDISVETEMLLLTR